MWICPKCGASSPDSANCCGHCGFAKSSRLGRDRLALIIAAMALASTAVRTVTVQQVRTFRADESAKQSVIWQIGKPGYTGIIGEDMNLTCPVYSAWLEKYETKCVKTQYGIWAYLCYSPTKDSDYSHYVYEWEKVTVLARQNGYSLCKTDDGRIGWVTSSLLVDRY